MTDERLLAIGPANFAGQATAWSASVQRHRGVPAFSFGYEPRPGAAPNFATDKHIPSTRANPLRRRREVERVLRECSHVIVDGFHRVYSLPKVGSLTRDYRRVARLAKLALISHGTDSRDLEAHAERHPWSFARECPPDYLRTMGRRFRRNQQVLADLGVPFFVVTPELLLDTPSAILVPNVVDVPRWATDRPVLEGARPRVLHMPTKRVPPIKGSAIIEPVLERLDSEGLIEWVRSGPVPHEEMPRLMASCDIVIDQITTGFYSTTTCEALAAGRIVVGNLTPETRASVPAPIPVHDTDPLNFEETFRAVLADTEAMTRLAEDGPEFAATIHDGRFSASQLSGFLDS